MTQTTTTVIAYWLDTTSDHADPRWVVSREQGDVSDTLRTLPAGATETDARLAAKRVAAAKGLLLERH